MEKQDKIKTETCEHCGKKIQGITNVFIIDVDVVLCEGCYKKTTGFGE